MKEKYYLAYGSNLSIAQMVQRCPYAVYVGKATIPNYQLLFKGSKTGSYLTIEKADGFTVPVGVWAVTEADEKRLVRRGLTVMKDFPLSTTKRIWTSPTRDW